MKHFLIISLLFFAGTVGAQHYVGVRGGMGNGSSRVFPQREMGTVWGLKSVGVGWKYYTDEPFVGGIAVDMMWMQQGYREYRMALVAGSEEREKVGYYERTVNAAMVPIMWQPHAYMFRQRLMAFMNAGVTLSFIHSSHEKEIDLKTGSTIFDREYYLHPTRDNRVGYGLVGGFGLAWINGRMEFFAEGRYYIGYSDILKNRNKYEENPLRSPLDGMQFQAGAFFRFGKGGIKSVQGRGQ